LAAAEEPELLELAPANATVTPGGSVLFTAKLDIPAPPGGSRLDLAVAPAEAGVVSGEIMIPEAAMQATFEYVDAGLASAATLSAHLQHGATLSATVT